MSNSGRRGRHNKSQAKPSQNRSQHHQQNSDTVAHPAAAVADPENQKPHAAEATNASTENGQDSEKSILDRQMVIWTAAIGRWTKVVALFTAMLFVATVASVVVLIITDFTFNAQLSVMKGQLAEMKSNSQQTADLIEANKKVADSAQISASAAKQSAETASTALIETQRPFIFHAPRPEYSTGPNSGFALSPAWENGGTTPPTELWLYSRCVPSPMMVSDPMPSWGLILPSRRTIGPRQRISGNKCDISPEEIADIASGRLFLYIVAKAEYRDRFSTGLHVTEYCSDLRIAEISQRGTLVTERQCATHNCTDEGCKPN